MENSTNVIRNQSAVTVVPNITTNVTDPMANYKAETATDLFFTVVHPILLLFGMIGNGLSFVVMIQLAKTTSFYLYLAALALADLILLPLVVLLQVFQQFDVYKNLFPNEFVYLCSMSFQFLIVFAQYSSWLTVAATLERFFVISNLFKASKVFTRKLAILYMIVLFAIIYIINFPIICFEWNTDYTQCIFPKLSNDYCLKYMSFLDPLIYILIPTIVIVSLNTMIVRKLYVASKARREQVNQTERRVEDNTNDVRGSTKRTTVTLFLVTASFIITKIPLSALYLFLIIANRTDQVFGEMALFLQITSTVTLMNHVINFILYGISGKIFREKLYRIICRCRK